MPSDPVAPLDPADRASAAALFDLIRGYIGSELLYVAAKLRLADYLAAGVRFSDDVAEQTRTHPAATRRVLQGLVALGICTHDADGGFSLTPLGVLLTSDHPLGYQNVAIIHKEVLQPAVSQMLQSVETGETGFRHAHGASLFEYLSEHPDAGQRFDRFMTTVSSETARAVLAVYDFSGVTTVIDIGGGHGTLVAAILRRYPAMRGVVFDLPHVVERAREYLQAHGVADRSELVSGDFFASVPADGDVYVLSQILHDWDDATCARILGRIRGAMRATSRLLVLERIMPEHIHAAESSVVTDLLMLTVTGGHERTERQYRELLTEAGFAHFRVLVIDSPFSIVEATA